jgi:hypothetical protein
MRTLISALVILASGPALADGNPGEHDMCMRDGPCRVATQAELDQLRGGLDVQTRHGNLRIDIGITRAVSVNDRIVAMSHIGAGQPSVSLGQATGPATGGTSQLRINETPVGSNGPALSIDGRALVVQNGPGNFAPLSTSFGHGAVPTIIQNSLDNQNLKTFTFVNASVNSLSVMRTLMMNDMVGRAVTASGR